MDKVGSEVERGRPISGYGGFVPGITAGNVFAHDYQKVSAMHASVLVVLLALGSAAIGRGSDVWYSLSFWLTQNSENLLFFMS